MSEWYLATLEGRVECPLCEQKVYDCPGCKKPLCIGESVVCVEHGERHLHKACAEFKGVR
jgi:hypothetical protein